MHKGLLVIGLVVVGVVVYFMFFAKKPEGRTAPTEQPSPQFSDAFPAPAVQGELNTRDIPAQVGLGTGLPVIDNSKDTQRALIAGDTLVGEDAIRALNEKLNSVLEVLIPKDGGVLVQGNQPESVNTSPQESITTPISTAKQISVLTQSGETVLAPESRFIKAKPGEKIMSVTEVAKKLGRPILQTSSGKSFLALGGRKFSTKFSLTESQVQNFLKEEQVRGR